MGGYLGIQALLTDSTPDPTWTDLGQFKRLSYGLFKNILILLRVRSLGLSYLKPYAGKSVESTE
jgi:hypothetical protein